MRVDIGIGRNGVVAVQPSLRADKVRKLVAGSEHGVRRQRGFLWGLAHGMALAKRLKSSSVEGLGKTKVSPGADKAGLKNFVTRPGTW